MMGITQQNVTARDDVVQPQSRPLAYFYIAEVFAVGAAALFWSLTDTSGAEGSWIVFAVLAIGATAAQAFSVVTALQQTSRPAVAFFTVGVALLSPLQLALLVILSFAAEGARIGRPWRLWAFDLASTLIATRTAAVIYAWLKVSSPYAELAVTTVVALFAAAACMVLTERLFAHVLVSLTTGAGRNNPVSLTNESILINLGLCCIGGTIAILWQNSPWLTVLAVPPLVLLGRYLRMPALEEEASLDAKTSLLNPRAFEARALKELERAARSRRSVAVIMADLDFLRKVNNNYGHLAGDIVLQRVARIIQACLPQNAFAARFGGEEFSIIVPDADIREGLAVAELIRTQVAETRFTSPTNDEPITVTISLGIATYPYNGHDLHGALHEADAAVYRAKMSGRNRACIALVGHNPLSPKHKDQVPSRSPSGEAPPSADSSTPASSLSPKPERLARTAEKVRRSNPAGVFTLLVAVVGPAVAVLYLAKHPIVPPIEGLLLFVILALAAEILAVDISSRVKATSSFVAVLAAILLYGVPAALLTAGSLAAFQGIVRRNNPRRVAFEFGTLVLAGTGATLVTSLFAHSISVDQLPYLVPVALAAGLVCYLIDTVLAAQAVAMDEQRRLLDVWNELFRWLAGHYLLMALLALVLAAAYASYGADALLAFAIPILAMRYAFKQYVDRTSETTEDLAKANQHLKSTYENTLLALVTALEARDRETEGHSERVANYAVRIGQEMGLAEEELRNLRLGALLHDIGKIGLPDAILRKSGPLSDTEWERMQNHPRTGFAILQGIEFLGGPSQVVVYHHERYDGKGYPHGLAGDQIPLLARIFAVADTFDAITSDRTYRAAQSPAAAQAEIQRCAGTQFDPDVVQAFVHAFSEEAENPARAAARRPATWAPVHAAVAALRTSA